jgi:uncharacterized protein (DUF433 family)
MVTEMLNGEPYEYYPIGDHVVSAVGVSGGRPTFKYTRIEVAGTVARIEAGESIEDVVEGYEGRVSREAVLEAIHIVTNGALASVA